MLGLFKNNVRARQYRYTPRFYDPEKDPDREQRLDFRKGHWSKDRPKVQRGPNTVSLFLLAVVMIALIWVLRNGFGERDHVPEVRLDPVQAVETEGGPAR